MQLCVQSMIGHHTRAALGDASGMFGSGVRACCPLVAGLLLMFAVTSAIQAQNTIRVEGNVLLTSDQGATFYADNPFTSANEGIPAGGNTINPIQLAQQTNFEGRTDTMGTATTADDVNVNFDIIVGQTSYGLLEISSGLELRDMDLIIGDSGDLPPGSTLARGTGYVIIDGPGSLYNNNPDIMPFFPPLIVPPGTSPSINDRSVEAGAAAGFDLYVGRNGNGNLSITQGGRGEIQDAVLVGSASGSVSTLLIDGIGSFLQSGGFEAGAGSGPDDVHYMIVGQLGSGTMWISNGGHSYNLGELSTSGSDDIFAAVIGSNEAADDTSAPGAGGEGTVYVDGIASKWTLGGNLQVGGFHDNDSLTSTDEDLDGNDAVYASGVGRGTLHVTNGALVSIVPPPLDDTASNAPDRLDLLVGAFGRIELSDGRIELLGAFNSTNPNNPTQQVQRGRLINDGVVAGQGSIDVLQFRNRVLGSVRVGAGQKLVVEATGTYAEIDNIPDSTEQEYPLSNYGVIDVLGTADQRAEIEFVRNAVSIDLETATNFTRPFLNLPIPATDNVAPNGRTEGLIHGEYSTMRFESGLWNRGVVAWTQGNNVVSGDVVSFAESAPAANDHGRVVIGPDTNVAFEDDFFTFGTTQISPGSSFQVLKGNSFAVGGNFGITVQGTSSGMNFDPYIITGNASFSGNLQVSFINGSDIPDTAAVPIFSVGGSIIGNFNMVTPSGLPFGSPIDFFTFVFGQQMYLAAFTVPATATDGDFNGDGQVNGFDYAIWRQNFGTAGPAGDANGDGIVNGADYTVWRDNAVLPGAGGLAGIGFDLDSFGADNFGAVPEPSAGLIALLGAVLALAGHRRKT